MKLKRQNGGPSAIIAQFFRFGLIGGLGFVVDTTLTLLLFDKFGPVISRLRAFSVAVIVTFILNRTITFVGSKTKTPEAEFGLYLTIQTFGALLNLGVFLGLLSIGPELKIWLFGYLIVSSAIGMIWNFVLCKWLIY